MLLLLLLLLLLLVSLLTRVHVGVCCVVRLFTSERKPQQQEQGIRFYGLGTFKIMLP